MKFVKSISLFNSKKLVLFSFGVAVFVLFYSFIRDWKLDEYRVPIDLRNRIVGARLLDTPHSPYTYHWQNSDPIELYDFARFKETEISAVTATPFLLYIYSGLNSLSFYSIAKIWLIFEYLCVVTIMLLSLIYLKKPIEKTMILLCLSLFTLGNPWQCHTDSGQYYILNSLLFFLFFIVIRIEKKSSVILILQLLFASILIFTRPISILFLIPLIFIFPRFKKFFIFLSSILLFFTLIIVVLPKQKKLWADYFSSVNYMSQFYQGKITPDFNFKEYTEPCNIEGYDIEKMEALNPKKNYKEYYFNYYKLPEEFGWKKFSMTSCLIQYLIIVLIGAFLVYNKVKLEDKFESKITYLLLFGFLIYILAEIFLPIQRASYNEVQWLFPLAIIFFMYKKNKLLILSFLLFLFFSIINFERFDLQVIFSELILLVSLFIYLVFPKTFLKKATVSIQNH